MNSKRFVTSLGKLQKAKITSEVQISSNLTPELLDKVIIKLMIT